MAMWLLEKVSENLFFKILNFFILWEEKLYDNNFL